MSAWSSAHGKPHLSYADRLRQAKEAREASGAEASNDNSTGANLRSQQVQPKPANQEGDTSTPSQQVLDSGPVESTAAPIINSSAIDGNRPTKTFVVPTAGSAQEADLSEPAQDSQGSQAAGVASEAATGTVQSSGDAGQPVPSKAPSTNVWDLRKKQMGRVSGKEPATNPPQKSVVAGHESVNPADRVSAPSHRPTSTQPGLQRARSASLGSKGEDFDRNVQVDLDEGSSSGLLSRPQTSLVGHRNHTELSQPSTAAMPQHDDAWLERISMLNGGQNLPAIDEGGKANIGISGAARLPLERDFVPSIESGPASGDPPTKETSSDQQTPASPSAQSVKSPPSVVSASDATKASENAVGPMIGSRHEEVGNIEGIQIKNPERLSQKKKGKQWIEIVPTITHASESSPNKKKTERGPRSQRGSKERRGASHQGPRNEDPTRSAHQEAHPLTDGSVVDGVDGVRQQRATSNSRSPARRASQPDSTAEAGQTSRIERSRRKDGRNSSQADDSRGVTNGAAACFAGSVNGDSQSTSPPKWQSDFRSLNIADHNDAHAATHIASADRARLDQRSQHVDHWQRAKDRSPNSAISGKGRGARGRDGRRSSLEPRSSPERRVSRPDYSTRARPDPSSHRRAFARPDHGDRSYDLPIQMHVNPSAVPASGPQNTFPLPLPHMGFATTQMYPAGQAAPGVASDMRRPEHAANQPTAVADSPLSQLVGQVEFYFSYENLLGDFFLRQQMEPSTGWVPIPLISSFKRVRKLSQALGVSLEDEQAQRVLHQSNHVELDEQGRRLRKRYGWQEWVIPDHSHAADPRLSGYAPPPAPAYPPLPYLMQYGSPPPYPAPCSMMQPGHAPIPNGLGYPQPVPPGPQFMPLSPAPYLHEASPQIPLPHPHHTTGRRQSISPSYQHFPARRASQKSAFSPDSFQQPRVSETVHNTTKNTNASVSSPINGSRGSATGSAATSLKGTDSSVVGSSPPSSQSQMSDMATDRRGSSSETGSRPQAGSGLEVRHSESVTTSHGNQNGHSCTDTFGDQTDQADEDDDEDDSLGIVAAEGLGGLVEARR